MGDWLLKYPHINKCISSLTEIIELSRHTKDCELEARFGLCGEKFIAGVDRKTMDSIVTMMTNSSYVKGDEVWVEEHDFYYDYDGKKIRTRVNFNTDTMNISTESTEKKLIHSIDCLHLINGITRGPNDVRISLKTEKKVFAVPPSVNSTLVRIKQRRRFVTLNNVWAFDFSMTWSGKTKTDAETNQMNNEPIYEIECELLDNSYFTTHSNDYIAASILLKMHDLLCDNSTLIPK